MAKRKDTSAGAESGQGAVTVKPKKKRGKSATSAEQIKLIQRRTWALDLKKQGLSYRRIARRLKEEKLVPTTYSEGLAYKDVRDAMGILLEEQKEVAAENLRLDLMRYEEMLERFWPLALPTVEEGEIEMPPNMVAVGAVMQILDKRSVLLNYKALWAEKEQPNFNINVDWSSFTMDEIIEIQQKVQAGEDAIVTITQIQQRKGATGSTPATGA